MTVGVISIMTRWGKGVWLVQGGEGLPFPLRLAREYGPSYKQNCFDTNINPRKIMNLNYSYVCIMHNLQHCARIANKLV